MEITAGLPFTRQRRLGVEVQGNSHDGVQETIYRLKGTEREILYRSRRVWTPDDDDDSRSIFENRKQVIERADTERRRIIAQQRRAALRKVMRQRGLGMRSVCAPRRRARTARVQRSKPPSSTGDGSSSDGPAPPSPSSLRNVGGAL
jgi:hypothetical protein